VTWLRGKRVGVTRSPDQADELAELFAAAGAVPVLVPLIEIVARPEEMQALRSVVPSEFAWVMVTSPNAAAALLESADAVELATTRLAAVGATTAARLPRCDLRPAPGITQGAAGLLQALDDVGEAGQPGALSGRRVLVVQAVDAEPVLVEGLAARGWDVVAIRPYRAEWIAPSAADRADAAQLDAVSFASGSAARAWAAAFGVDTAARTAAIGDQTAAAMRSVGLKVDVIASDHSLAGLVAALDDPPVERSDRRSL
jgi:uroporphyrinogen-III synthase